MEGESKEENQNIQNVESEMSKIKQCKVFLPPRTELY